MDWRTFHSLTNHNPEHTSPKEAEPDRPIPMDPQRRPHPFKEYETSKSAVELIDNRNDWLAGVVPVKFDLEGLSRILLFGAGAKRYRRAELRQRYFRTYASAGALHPNEIYVATSGVEGLDSGLYHFNPRDRLLVTLGEGDPRPLLGEGPILDAPIVLILTGIPWRTSWKYRERGYRHLWWDAGMIIANLQALADAAGLPASVRAHFGDDEVNDLIGVDGVVEMALALVALGSGASSGGREFHSYGLTAKPIGPRRPYEFTDITAVHRSTTVNASTALERNNIDLAHVALPGDDPVDAVIWRRGSTRGFEADSTTDFDTAIAMLRYATAGFPCDWGLGLCDVYVITHGINRIEAGAYKWQDGDLELVRKDDESRDNATFVSLEQTLGGDGAFVVFPMANLEDAARIRGERGYRLAQLEGAIISGRLYLAAFAAGMGATGLTFYDDEVSKYFGISASPMLEVSVGTPAKRKPPEPPLASPQNLDFTELDGDALPKHWQTRIRGYALRVESGVLSIEHVKGRPRQGVLWQAIEAGEFRGKELRFSAEIEAEMDDESVAGLFMNVIGPKGTAGWDNMQESPVKGSSPWTSYSVKLEIPEDAVTFTVGLWLNAKGVVRFRNLSLATAGG